MYPNKKTLIAVCETETSVPAVLDDVPNCEIEQTEVCTDGVCRTVPQQKCSITKQGYIQCVREIDSHRSLFLGSSRISLAITNMKADQNLLHKTSTKILTDSNFTAALNIHPGKQKALQVD